MTDLVERLEEGIRDIHAGKTTHSVSDLKRLVNITEEVCIEATEDDILEPYSEFAMSIAGLVTRIGCRVEETKVGKEIIQAYGFSSKRQKINFQFKAKSGPTLHGYLRRALTRIDEQIEGFQMLFIRVCEEVRFDVCPAERFSEVKNVKPYFSKGRFIIPTRGGYHLLDFAYKRTPGRIDWESKSATESPITYFEAIVREFSGGLIIVKNTQKYPLETSVPVVLHKYGLILATNPNT